MTEVGRRQRLPGPLLLIVVLLIACSNAAPETGGNVVRLIGTDSDGAEFELTVIAPQALVLGGQSLPRPEGLSDTGVQLDAGGRGLLIWWPALPCQDRPVITLAGIDDGVTIQVDKGPREESVCQMNEVQLTVQLRLAREISSVEMAP